MTKLWQGIVRHLATVAPHAAQCHISQMQHDSALLAARQALMAHPLLDRLRTADAWRIFMGHHVFAVWDFMSLAKRLQSELTCTQVPWLPPKNPGHARFINEIVLAEESDEDGKGGYCSHFSFYRRAMDEAHADGACIDRFIDGLKSAIPLEEAVQACAPSVAVAQFVGYTLKVARFAAPHVVASVFFYGREDVIPAMFTSLTEHVLGKDPAFALLHDYLRRHIDLDGDSHGPLAAQMLQSLCAGDPQREHEARTAALEALEHRHALWTGIAQAIDKGPT